MCGVYQEQEGSQRAQAALPPQARPVARHALDVIVEPITTCRVQVQIRSKEICQK